MCSRSVSCRRSNQMGCRHRSREEVIKWMWLKLEFCILDRPSCIPERVAGSRHRGIWIWTRTMSLRNISWAPDRPRIRVSIYSRYFLHIRQRTASCRRERQNWATHSIQGNRLSYLPSRRRRLWDKARFKTSKTWTTTNNSSCIIWPTDHSRKI